MKNRVTQTKWMIILFALLIFACEKNEDNPIDDNTKVSNTKTISTNNISSKITIDRSENPKKGDQLIDVVPIEHTGKEKYSIANQSPKGACSLDTKSGMLSVADSTLFDFETHPVITITTTTSISGKTIGKTLVTINLMDETEITVPGKKQTITLDENIPAGVIPGGQIKGSTDIGTLTYVIIKQNPEGAITIDHKTGVISVADSRLFDYERHPTLTAIVQLSSGQTRKNIEVEIQLNDLNDGLSIPDVNFKKALLNYDPPIDTNGDGYIMEDEALKVTSLNLKEKNIADLTGIEYSKNLTELSCSMNPLKNLDISQNTALTSLTYMGNEITGHQLSSLDVSKNLALKSLHCPYNRLTELDISNNTALTSLWFNNNMLTTLDVSKNTELFYLSCNSNSLTSLDISQLKKLRIIVAYNNKLSYVNLKSGTNESLITVNLENNNSASLCVEVDDPTAEYLAKWKTSNNVKFVSQCTQ